MPVNPQVDALDDVLGKGEAGAAPMFAIKPLFFYLLEETWTDTHDLPVFANSPFGRYIVQQDQVGLWRFSLGHFNGDSCFTKSEAISAAQADFEARMREGLLEVK